MPEHPPVVGDEQGCGIRPRQRLVVANDRPEMLASLIERRPRFCAEKVKTQRLRQKRIITQAIKRMTHCSLLLLQKKNDMKKQIK